MRQKVLVSAPYFLPVLDNYRSFFEEHNLEIVTLPVAERIEEQELLKIIDQIDGVICGDDRFKKSVGGG